MSVIGSMNLEMAYYNAKLALWEPVIEPIVSVNPGDVLIPLFKNISTDLLFYLFTSGLFVFQTEL
jgi:hypothetical protein